MLELLFFIALHHIFLLFCSDVLGQKPVLNFVS